MMWWLKYVEETSSKLDFSVKCFWCSVRFLVVYMNSVEVIHVDILGLILACHETVSPWNEQTLSGFHERKPGAQDNPLI